MNGKVIDEWKPGVSLFSHIQFSCLVNPEDAGNDWYNFEKLENIPRSIKYEFTHDRLRFVRAPGHEEYKEVELDLWEGLQLMEQDDRFHLNPVRWDNVGRDLSEGWCFCPWLYFDEKECKPKLMDGRHRIVAMMKFTRYQDIPFVVSQEDKHPVKNYFDQQRATDLND